MRVRRVRVVVSAGSVVEMTRLRYAPPVDDYVPRLMFRGRAVIHVLSRDEEQSARDHGWTDNDPHPARRRPTDDERLSGRG